MIHMSVLKYLWSDVVLSAGHLINRIPSFALDGQIPFSFLYSKKSVFSITLRVFGCTYFVQDLSPALDKFSPRSIQCVFVGILELKRDIGVITLPPGNILCLQMSRFLSLFHISPHRILLLPLKLFLFHCLCHFLHLLLLILHSYYWYILQSHLHQNQFGISDTSTLISKRFLSLNQLQLTPLLQTVLLFSHQYLSLILISPLLFVKITGLALIVLFQSPFFMIILTPLFVRDV